MAKKAYAMLCVRICTNTRTYLILLCLEWERIFVLHTRMNRSRELMCHFYSVYMRLFVLKLHHTSHLSFLNAPLKLKILQLLVVHKIHLRVLVCVCVCMHMKRFIVHVRPGYSLLLLLWLFFKI